MSRKPQIHNFHQNVTIQGLTYPILRLTFCNFSWPHFLQMWLTRCFDALNVLFYYSTTTLSCIDLFTCLASLLNYKLPVTCCIFWDGQKNIFYYTYSCTMQPQHTFYQEIQSMFTSPESIWVMTCLQPIECSRSKVTWPLSKGQKSPFLLLIVRSFFFGVI